MLPAFIALEPGRNWCCTNYEIISESDFKKFSKFKLITKLKKTILIPTLLTLLGIELIVVVCLYM